MFVAVRPLMTGRRSAATVQLTCEHLPKWCTDT